MITKDLPLNGSGDFGHDEQAPNDGAGELVQLTKLLMPGLLSLYQGRDPAFRYDGAPVWVAGQSDEVRQVREG